jgi:hypothetical protein
MDSSEKKREGYGMKGTREAALNQRLVRGSIGVSQVLKEGKELLV